MIENTKSHVRCRIPDNVDLTGSSYEKPVCKESVSRPNIDVKKSVAAVSAILLFFLAGILLPFIVYSYTRSVTLLVLCILLLLIYFFVTLKKFMVLSILLYQRFAPEDLRLSCLFQPSCSEYMLLAIEKYGVIKGTYVGIKRLLRCHPPNGGTDYP